MSIKIHVELITDWEEATTIEACEFAQPMKEFAAETVSLSSSTSWPPRHGRWLGRVAFVRSPGDSSG